MAKSDLASEVLGAELPSVEDLNELKKQEK